MFSSNEGMYEHLCRKEKIKLFFCNTPSRKSNGKEKKQEQKRKTKTYFIFKELDEGRVWSRVPI
jgi:hypothetical protein